MYYIFTLNLNSVNVKIKYCFPFVMLTLFFFVVSYIVILCTFFLNTYKPFYWNFIKDKTATYHLSKSEPRKHPRVMYFSMKFLTHVFLTLTNL